MTKRILIIAAATIGSGEFALPYIIARAGWATTLLYFIILGAMVIAAHAVYLKVLAAEGEKERLLGLGRKYFGAGGFWFGFVAIVLGLLLSFVIFLILGTQFLELIFPALPYLGALFIFWLMIAIPALLGNRRVVSLETVSVMSVAVVMAVIFASSNPASAFVHVPAIDWHGALLPFGVVLFMIAGWTGVEPFYEARKRTGKKDSPWLALILGTAFAGFLYWFFAVGILGSAPHLTSDTISGLVLWPFWKRALVAILGLFAIGTVAMPISHELRNALEKDLHWQESISLVTVLGLPLAAVLLGFNDFLAIVGIAGGLFISMEYILIIAVGRRALTLGAVQRSLLDFMVLVFVCAAVYSVYVFVVH